MRYLPILLIVLAGCGKKEAPTQPAPEPQVVEVVGFRRVYDGSEYDYVGSVINRGPATIHAVRAKAEVCGTVNGPIVDVTPNSLRAGESGTFRMDGYRCLRNPRSFYSL